MKRELQDKRWENLSPRCKHYIIILYNSYRFNDTASVVSLKTMEEIFGIHNLLSIPKLEDVAKELDSGEFDEFFIKLKAIGRLMFVAKVLNKNEDGSDWVPGLNDEIWAIAINRDSREIEPVAVDIYDYSTEIVVFSSEKLTLQAIKILGEVTIRTALGTC